MYNYTQLFDMWLDGRVLMLLEDNKPVFYNPSREQVTATEEDRLKAQAMILEHARLFGPT